MRWQKVSDFVIRLPHRPGALASLAARLREADIEMLGMWGPVQGRHTTGFHCIPASAEQFRSFSRDSDMDAFEQVAFLLSDPARAGGLIAALDAIAQAGINIEVIQSIVVDGAISAIVWVDEADEPALAQVLSTR
jgi:prephenate dehydratase